MEEFALLLSGGLGFFSIIAVSLLFLALIVLCIILPFAIIKTKAILRDNNYLLGEIRSELRENSKCQKEILNKLKENKGRSEQEIKENAVQDVENWAEEQKARLQVQFDNRYTQMVANLQVELRKRIASELGQLGASGLTAPADGDDGDTIIDAIVSRAMKDI